MSNKKNSHKRHDDEVVVEAVDPRQEKLVVDIEAVDPDDQEIADTLAKHVTPEVEDDMRILNETRYAGASKEVVDALDETFGRARVKALPGLSKMTVGQVIAALQE